MPPGPLPEPPSTPLDPPAGATAEPTEVAPAPAFPPAAEPAAAGGDVAVAPVPPPARRRLVAAGEVVLCSGFPTQLTLVVLLGLLGAGPTDGSGALSLGYVVTLSLIDTALILWFVWLLLRAGGESPAAVMVGGRPIGRELVLGLKLVPAALLIVLAAFAVLSRVAPELRNVPENPLQALLTSPAAAVVFGAVVVVAGGLREEVQRAFILRRFEQHLGGAAVGLVVFSTAFGLGHLVQGRDAAIITGLLGALWGLLYLKRGSMVAPFACHAGFNATEVLIAYWGGGG